MYVRSSLIAEYGSTSKVVNPARGHLNGRQCFFSCSRSRLIIWSRETGSAIPSRVSLLIFHTQVELGEICDTESIDPGVDAMR